MASSWDPKIHVEGGGSPLPELPAGLLYSQLRDIARRLMRSERRGHTLQATALVNEAWLKLATGQRQHYADQHHFLCVAARAMRQTLLDHARARRAKRRSASEDEIASLSSAASIQPLSTDLLALDEAMLRLEAVNPRLVRIVELRCFAGLNVAETAQVLQISASTVKREWSIARAFIMHELAQGAAG